MVHHRKMCLPVDKVRQKRKSKCRKDVDRVALQSAASLQALSLRCPFPSFFAPQRGKRSERSSHSGILYNKIRQTLNDGQTMCSHIVAPDHLICLLSPAAPEEGGEWVNRNDRACKLAQIAGQLRSTSLPAILNSFLPDLYRLEDTFYDGVPLRSTVHGHVLVVKQSGS